eukprot:scaffold66087_cov31-Tisochrysis_lutea.AAC.3
MAAQDHLRREKLLRAAYGRETALARARQRCCQPKVGQASCAIRGKEDVGRFHITVYESPVMHEGKGTKDGSNVEFRLVDSEYSVGRRAHARQQVAAH